jgi:hypothetical protein
VSEERFLLLKLTVGALATIGLYSVLYKENKVYRFFEHLFLGLAVGFSLVALWKETLYVQWWQKMMGTPGSPGVEEVQGMWLYAVLLPIGLMGYLVFNKKHNWMSRIPIGVILGAWSGQQVLNWWTTYGPQISGSFMTILPTTWSSVRMPARQALVGGNVVPVPPEVMAQINANVYPTQALNNLIFLVTLLSALSYFLFSYELKGKFMNAFNTYGRWMLMIGFGCIFGSTVMARFALVIDRMSFIFVEWVRAAGGVFTGG